jgi:hypothetical protein
MPVESLTNIPLAFPSRISLTGSKEPRSWIQLARTGKFKSNRYGAFEISSADLSQMLHNFTHITPLPPTQLPIDYDHLSMDPKKPGDGIAAGWLQQVELRAEGTELWGEVAWTPDAAQRIQNREYQFVSPSFVKNHTHKTGEKIGTTLLAAAITNHPFLEGMRALTLYSCSAMGDLATEMPPEVAALQLADGPEQDQRVIVNDDDEEEWTAEERETTFIVKTAVGDGDDRFVKLVALDGRRLPGWRRATQLGPAPAPNKDKENPMPAKTQTDVQLSATEQLALKLTKGTDAGSAAKNLSDDDVKGYLLEHNIGGAANPVEPEEAASLVHNLRQLPGETFLQLVARLKHERNLDDRAALLLCSSSFPELAATYSAGGF